jgi:hypothetical protein
LKQLYIFAKIDASFNRLLCLVCLILFSFSTFVKASLYKLEAKTLQIIKGITSVRTSGLRSPPKISDVFGPSRRRLRRTRKSLCRLFSCATLHGLHAAYRPTIALLFRPQEPARQPMVRPSSCSRWLWQVGRIATHDLLLQHPSETLTKHKKILENTCVTIANI